MVSNLAAGLVPLNEFPLRRWYYVETAAGRPRWYYHARALEHRLRDGPRFYELIDPPLRELCRIVLRAGLFTTPSCAGHFHLPEHYRAVWSDLWRDAAAVRAAGLVVTDSENGAGWAFRNAAYELPWRDCDAFCEEVMAHQNEGYIGVIVPAERRQAAARLQAWDVANPAVRIVFENELSRLFDQQTFGVYTWTRTPTERDAVWAEVTARLRRLLAWP